MNYHRPLLLALALPLAALAAPDTAPDTAPTTATAPAAIILGQGKLTGFYLTGQNYGKKNYYAHPLPVKTARSQIHMRSDTAHVSEENTQVIRFDLPPVPLIPPGMEIKSAKVIFPIISNAKADKSKTSKIVIFQMLVDWNNHLDWKTYDGQHAWQTPGADGEKDRKKVTTIDVPEHPYDYKTPYETSADITVLVKDWASGKEPNYGIKLEQIGGYTEYMPEKFRLEIALQPAEKQ